ncbi:MAG TPA: hypothetical protein VKX17_10535 [Planctomycetota bacterium]|nr:hypothetical protein [Planctomycetota bacterium]
MNELWDIYHEEFPNLFVINFIVRVNQYVSQRRYLSPLDGRIARLKSIRNAARCFANHGQLSCNGALEKIVLKECAGSFAFYKPQRIFSRD